MNFTVTGLVEIDLRNLGSDDFRSSGSHKAKRLLAEAAQAPDGATIHVLVDSPPYWDAVRYFRSCNPHVQIVVVGDSRHVQEWINELRGPS